VGVGDLGEARELVAGGGAGPEFGAVAQRLTRGD
jgi:hypothetical protein